MKLKPSTNAVILILVFVATASLYSLWLLGAIREDRTETRTAMAATTPTSGKNDVRLDAWINDSHLVAKQPLGFWIAIQNNSPDLTISEVKILTFRSPGFTLPDQQVAAGCWDSGKPSCTNTRVPNTRFDSLTLAPREARTIEGQIVAGSEPGPYSVSAVVEWKDGAGVTRRKPISVGPVFVQVRWRAYALIAAQAAQRFLKDLALPIMLAVLAFVLNQIEQKRAEERRRAADAIADEKKAAEERSLKAQKEAAERTAEMQKEAAVRAALVRQTWMMMLPKAHENSEKHYMPLAANAESVEDHYPADGELAFFNYLRFLSGMRLLIVAIGGFYLKNRDGEWLLSKVWDSIRMRSNTLFTRVLREEAQSLVGPQMLLGDFNDLSLPGSTIDGLRKKFLEADNYQAFRIQVTLLRLFKLILEYEMNDVYEPWYGKPETFPANELQASIAELKRYTDQGEFAAEEFAVLNDRLTLYMESSRAQGQGSSAGTEVVDGTQTTA